ncbi:energy transducer TonB, partial [Rhodoblastus acidophilus]
PRASAGSAAAFRACLQAHARYPTSKEARQQNPHGAVGVSVSVSGGAIAGVSVTSSSGSGLLDQAARASVLSSGCGSAAGGASQLTGRIVF